MRARASFPDARETADAPGGPHGSPTADAELEDAGGGGDRAGGAVVAALLLLILAAGLVLRVRNNGYGLPYVYNGDEAQHFVTHSVAMFGGTYDPGYYQNPSGYTYLVFVALKVFYGILGFHLPAGTVSKQFALDPTPIWRLARTVSALIAMAGVVATFLCARRIWGTRVALVAAALLTFAFLPVVYSRVAVTDIGTLLPVAVALYGAFCVLDHGRLKHYLTAGAGIGLATGFKYTAALVLLPLLVAAGARLWRDRGTSWLQRTDLRYLVLASAVAVLVFAISTPFFFVHPHAAVREVRAQAQVAGQFQKTGQGQQNGFSYYVHTFGWGFGWAAAGAALIGALLELRRDLLRGVMLVVFPVALFVYMSMQTRYFGRWLLPLYPVLAILSGIAVVRIAELVRGVGDRLRGPRRLGGALSGGLALLLTALILIQPLAADIRTSNVLGREDTRQIARDWLVEHYRLPVRIVTDFTVPPEYDLKTEAERDHDPGLGSIPDFIDYVRAPQSADATLSADTYASSIAPGRIDAYRSAGFCLVMTDSLMRGRVENARLPQPLAYYRRLEHESDHVFHVSPFKQGRKPVPLQFDFSNDYYPTAYYRPGGIVDVYKLHDCEPEP